MPRRKSAFGPMLTAVIEDAPAAQLRAVLAHQEREVGLSIDLAGPSAFDNDDVYRAHVTEVLSAMQSDDLRPLEDRCRRIRSLAEGKGTTSLDTLVSQRLSDGERDLYHKEPDALCRSIRVYLHHERVFEDAESFHFARRFRDVDKFYDAFEAGRENASTIDPDAIDTAVIAGEIAAVLDLRTRCTVRAVGLPPAASYPPSLMLIARHGGPRSSVQVHRDDGRPGLQYYVPRNEIALIWTPDLGQVEVCADERAARPEVAKIFARTVLGQDLSKKPLTWKRYNLSRFRESLSLPIPVLDGVDVRSARVVEVEVRLGTWSRRMGLKVTFDDDIERIADRYLGRNNILRSAEGFSKIQIAVRYFRVGDRRERTLKITLFGTSRSDLQGKTDPEERALGFDLLRNWGILTTLEPLDVGDLRALFPHLAALHEQTDDTVTGSHLQDLGLDPERLIAAGLLDRSGKQDVILIDEEDGTDLEATIGAPDTPTTVVANDSFGRDLGSAPAHDMSIYRINRGWLDETIERAIRPVLEQPGREQLEVDLVLLGFSYFWERDVPIYLARRLADPDVIRALDLALRARRLPGIGIVLTTSRTGPAHLGAAVVMPLFDHLVHGVGNRLLDDESIEVAYRTGQSLALGGTVVALMRSGPQSACLYLPGKPPLQLTGANQILIFDRLVDAHMTGSPDVKAGALINGTGVKSPSQAFRKAMWQSIVGEYIEKGSKGGYWRLAV